LDAVSYAVSALLLVGIRKQEEAPPRAARRSLRSELGEGLRYVFRHPYQRTMVAMTALSNFFGQVVFSILLVYAVRELDLSAGTIGVALAIGNLGTLAAALTAKRIGDRLGVGRTILLASCLFGPGTLLIAFAPQEYALPLIVLAMIVIGFGGILYNVTAISLIQAITPERVLEAVTCDGVVQVLSHRRDRAPVEVELTAWIATGREQQLGPARRRLHFLPVELDLLPGEPGEAK